MKVVTRGSADEAASFAARLIADAVRARPDTILGLATGRTMEGVYRALGRLRRDETIDFGRCRSFNLDEYVGLRGDDPRSYRAFMARHFVAVVGVGAERVDLPAGDAPEPEREADLYEGRIASAGGIDLQLLGIGENGHVGFNEPGTPFDARTHVATLTSATREQNAAMFGGDERAVPRQAITMGLGTILEARRVVLLATGAAKGEMIALG